MLLQSLIHAKKSRMTTLQMEAGKLESFEYLHLVQATPRNRGDNVSKPRHAPSFKWRTHKSQLFGFRLQHNYGYSRMFSYYEAMFRQARFFYTQMTHASRQQPHAHRHARRARYGDVWVSSPCSHNDMKTAAIACSIPKLQRKLNKRALR
jgi:hypothetical protein